MPKGSAIGLPAALCATITASFGFWRGRRAGVNSSCRRSDSRDRLHGRRPRRPAAEDAAARGRPTEWASRGRMMDLESRRGPGRAASEVADGRVPERGQAGGSRGGLLKAIRFWAEDGQSRRGMPWYSICAAPLQRFVDAPMPRRLHADRRADLVAHPSTPTASTSTCSRSARRPTNRPARVRCRRAISVVRRRAWTLGGEAMTSGDAHADELRGASGSEQKLAWQRCWRSALRLVRRSAHQHGRSAASARMRSAEKLGGDVDELGSRRHGPHGLKDRAAATGNHAERAAATSRTTGWKSTAPSEPTARSAAEGGEVASDTDPYLGCRPCSPAQSDSTRAPATM
jgi:hypothetical protein